MKRLRELDPDSPLLEQAQKLLASTDALPDSQERMLRVRRRLDRPRRGGLFAFARRLPALAVLGVLLMFGASAFAALRLFSVVTARPVLSASPLTAAGKGRRASQPQQQAVVASAPTPVMNEAVAARSAPAPAVNEIGALATPGERPARKLGQAHKTKPLRTRVSHAGHAVARAATRVVPLQPTAADARLTPGGDTPRQQPSEAPANAARSQASTADGAVESAAPVPQPSAAHAHAAGSAAAMRPEPAVDSSTASSAQPANVVHEAPLADSELVHRALKALRHDHDPALAARLLEQRRPADRNGPLAEEALALQIEASTQLKQARSRELARGYLARYPSGRYRDVAQRALQEPVP